MADNEKTISQSQPKRYAEAVAKAMVEFGIDRDHKSFYVLEMDEADKLKACKHWDLTGPDGNPLRSKEKQAKRPNAVENVTFALVDGMVSEFSDLPDLIYFPVEQGDEAAATAQTDITQAILVKNGIEEQFEEWRNNFFWHGTGIWYHPWDPLWMGGRGPNRWVGDARVESLHPRSVFPDARCGGDIHRGRRIHVAKYVTLDYVRDKYPKWGSLAEAESINAEYVSSDDDVIPNTQDSEGMTLLVQTWYIGKPPVLEKGEKDEGVGLHLLTWCGESKGVYLSHANYVYFEPDEDPKLPMTFRQFKKRDGSVWGYGAPIFIKQEQIIHNKNVETMTEGHLHSALGRGLYNAGALTPKQAENMQKNGTLPGMMFEVNDIMGIRREYGGSMPSTLQAEVMRGPKSMENTLGRPDVTQGKNPGSVTAAAALNLLQNRAASRYKSVLTAIVGSFKEMGDYLARLVWQNYTERRAYRIIGKDAAKDEFVLKKQGFFRTEDYQKLYNRDTGMSLRMAETPNPEEMLASGDWELYSPEFDLRCKTSQAMPSDRMVAIEWAMKLLQTGAIDIQLFLEVVEKGRFPAWSEVGQRYELMKQQQMQMQAQAMAQKTGIPQDNTTPQVDEAQIQAMVDQMSPEEAQAKLAELTGRTVGPTR